MVGLQIVHTPEQGTVLEGTRRGDGVIEVLRTAGLRRWRWSRQVGEHGAWYLPGTRDRLPPFPEIEHSATALRAAGFAVGTSVDDQPRSVADAEADRAARLDDRAQRLTERAERHGRSAQHRENAAARILDGIPLGQPILVGHHSERRHRRDLDRAETHDQAAREHDRRAADAARAAEVAAGHMRHRESPQVVAGRLERLQAQRRQVQRSLDGHSTSGRRAAGRQQLEPRSLPAGEYRDRLLAQASLLDAQIRHWSGVHEAHRAAGRIDTVDWDQVRPGDLLEYRGRWEVVRRVNKTTVTVVVDPGWNDKIVKRGVTAHRPAAHAPGDREANIPPARARQTTGPAVSPRSAAPSTRPQRGGGPTAGAGP